MSGLGLVALAAPEIGRVEEIELEVLRIFLEAEAHRAAIEVTAAIRICP